MCKLSLGILKENSDQQFSASTDRKTEAKQSKAKKTKAKHAEFRRAS